MIAVRDRTFRVIIHISVYVGIFLALHFFLGARVFNTLDTEQSNMADMQKKLSETEKLIRDNPNPKKKMEEIRAKMEEVEKKAVSENELPRIIQQLTKKSSELNIEIIAIKPIKEVPFQEKNLPQGVTKAYIEVVLRAPYNTIGEYLKALEEMPIIFTVEGVAVEKSDRAEEIRPGKTRREADSKSVITTLLISSYSILKF